MNTRYPCGSPNTNKPKCQVCERGVLCYNMIIFIAQLSSHESDDVLNLGKMYSSGVMCVEFFCNNLLNDKGTKSG